ncbi:phage protease [Brevundimonas sp.]|uniref:phage protease n=1 Tax=Brevundimonas sp. TaxID=1871086 RepID=UPI003D6D0088
MTDTATRVIGIMSATSAGEEHWVQLAPLGQFQGKDGRGPYAIKDRKAAEAVINATLRHHGEADIVIDYDHQSDFGARPGVGGTAPAAGWITELEARHDGLWGRVEWTDAASSKLRTREYRYLSPVFTFDQATGAIAKVLRAGLTNNPNLHLKAVASTDMSKTNTDTLVELRSILGLTDVAGMDAVVEAVRALAAKAVNAYDPAKHVPIEALERVTAQLNGVNNAGLSAEAAEIAVNSAVSGGKLPPALRDWGIALCQSDKSAFDGFVTRTGGAMAHLFETRHRAASDTSIHTATGVEAEVASQLGLAVENMKA